jgi:hypothetical protein
MGALERGEENPTTKSNKTQQHQAEPQQEQQNHTDFIYLASKHNFVKAQEFGRMIEENGSGMQMQHVSVTHCFVASIRLHLCSLATIALNR